MADTIDPYVSAIEDLGPHLLGRDPSPPDDRDHPMKAALESLEAAPAPDDSLAGLTVGAAIEAGYFGSWQQIRAFWKWVKGYVKPQPEPPAPQFRRRTWNIAFLLDQGQTPHCTAYSGAHWGISDPINSDWTKDDAEVLYYRQKDLDGQPRQENGSYVRTTAKVMLERGRIGEYVFASNVDEIVQWLLNHGPVMLGVNWYRGMFKPDANGVVSLTGPLDGGHAFLAIGVDLDTGLVECANSWGLRWAKAGRFYMRITDLARLLAEDGEACAGLELALAA